MLHFRSRMHNHYWGYFWVTTKVICPKIHLAHDCERVSWGPKNCTWKSFTDLYIANICFNLTSVCNLLFFVSGPTNVRFVFRQWGPHTNEHLYFWTDADCWFLIFVHGVDELVAHLFHMNAPPKHGAHTRKQQNNTLRKQNSKMPCVCKLPDDWPLANHHFQPSGFSFSDFVSVLLFFFFHSKTIR